MNKGGFSAKRLYDKYWQEKLSISGIRGSEAGKSARNRLIELNSKTCKPWTDSKPTDS